MPLPKTLKEMKFLLFPLIAIPLACVFAFNSPARKAHEAEFGAVASIRAPVRHAVAEYRGEEFSLSLLQTSSYECQNLMGEIGWYDAGLSASTGQQTYGHVTRACWRKYEDFQLNWNGAHYEHPVIAICPMVDGIQRYEGCVNMNSDKFEWQPR